MYNLTVCISAKIFQTVCQNKIEIKKLHTWVTEGYWTIVIECVDICSDTPGTIGQV